MWSQICYGPFTTTFGVSKSCAINTIWYSNSIFNINFHWTLLNLRISNNWELRTKLQSGLRTTFKDNFNAIKATNIFLFGGFILKECVRYLIFNVMRSHGHNKSVKQNCEVLTSFHVYALSSSSWQVLTSFCVCSLNLSSYSCTWVHFDLCACFWHVRIFSHFSIEI
jgi:hypothetical protein